MNRLIFFYLLCALIFPLSVRAQDPKPEDVPTPPFVAPLPDDTILTMKITNQLSNQKLSPGVRIVNQLVIIKSGTTREVISKWTDGTDSAVWFSEGYRLEQNPEVPGISITPLPGGTRYQSPDFPNLDWLAKSTYVGVQDRDGQDCYYFKTEITLKEQHMIVDYSAYINKKTKLPVAWSMGPTHFETVSVEDRNADSPLVLPDAFVQQLKAYRLAVDVTHGYKKQ